MFKHAEIDHVWTTVTFEAILMPKDAKRHHVLPPESSSAPCSKSRAGDPWAFPTPGPHGSYGPQVDSGSSANDSTMTLTFFVLFPHFLATQHGSLFFPGFQDPSGAFSQCFGSTFRLLRKLIRLKLVTPTRSLARRSTASHVASCTWRSSQDWPLGNTTYYDYVYHFLSISFLGEGLTNMSTMEWLNHTK